MNTEDLSGLPIETLLEDYATYASDIDTLNDEMMGIASEFKRRIEQPQAATAYPGVNPTGVWVDGDMVPRETILAALEDTKRLDWVQAFDAEVDKVSHAWRVTSEDGGCSIGQPTARKAIDAAIAMKRV